MKMRGDRAPFTGRQPNPIYHAGIQIKYVGLDGGVNVSIGTLQHPRIVLPYLVDIFPMSLPTAIQRILNVRTIHRHRQK